MPRHTARVVFMGSPDFAVPTLDALVVSDAFDVVSVVTQPDRPRGRGRKLSPTAVKARARAHGLPVLDMSRASTADAVSSVTAMRPDFIVVAAFGVILRRGLLTLPPYGCINLHASLLPRHRGVAPIQAAILAGDRETGCTTMLMDAGVDTGDILLTVTTPIEDDDTAGTLEARLGRLGAPLVVETLRGILAGTVHPRKQAEADATYARKIGKNDGQIDWDRPAVDVWRRVRAMSPRPGAFTAYRGKRLVIAKARRATAETAPADAGRARPGEILAVSPLCVASRDGALEVLRVKVEGKNEMDASAFVSGYRPAVGDVFGWPRGSASG